MEMAFSMAPGRYRSRYRTAAYLKLRGSM